jgi:hypothetical protein
MVRITYSGLRDPLFELFGHMSRIRGLSPKSARQRFLDSALSQVKKHFIGM